MRRRHLAATGAIALLALAPRGAARAGGPPPPGARPLSEIVAELEARPDFAYVEEIELDDGVWEIEYRTTDGRKRRIEIDPVSGAER